MQRTICNNCLVRAMEIDRASDWMSNQMRCTGVCVLCVLSARRWNSGEQMLLMAFESLCDCPFIIQWGNHTNRYFETSNQLRTLFDRKIEEEKKRFFHIIFNSWRWRSTAMGVWRNEKEKVEESKRAGGRVTLTSHRWMKESAKLLKLIETLFMWTDFFCHHFFLCFVL